MRPKRHPARHLTPRNPLVAAALFRKAGEHKKPNKSLRRKAKIAFKQETDFH